MLKKTITHLIKFTSIISILAVFSVAYADHKAEEAKDIIEVCGEDDSSCSNKEDEKLLNYQNYVKQAKDGAAGGAIPLPLNEPQIKQGTTDYDIYNLSTDGRSFGKVKTVGSDDSDNKLQVGDNPISNDMIVKEHYIKDGVQYYVVINKAENEPTDEDKQFMTNHDKLAEKFRQNDIELQQMKTNLMNAKVAVTKKKEAVREESVTTSGLLYREVVTPKSEEQKKQEKKALEEARDTYLDTRQKLTEHINKMDNTVYTPRDHSAQQPTSKPDNGGDKTQRLGVSSASVTKASVVKKHSHVEEKHMKPSKIDRVVTNSSEIVGNNVIDKANNALLDE